MLPVRHRRSLTALIVAALLATPASAFAQSAGDDQYADPFGDNGGNSQPQGGGGDDGGGSQPQTGGGGEVPVTPTQETPVDPLDPSTTDTTAGGEQLARTGGHELALLIAGIVLALTGGALRFLVRARPARLTAP